MNWDYPELYYRIYPKLLESMNEHLGTDYSYDSISDEKAQIIIDDVYNKMVKEYPEIDSDPLDRRGRGRVSSSQRYYGRRRIVRDLIAIFLISELLRRNRDNGIYTNPYFYPY
ncbi:hypothetical protein [Tissierella sp. Yu-01]|uniref:hypothetical protein n=1 Tax=Tissierella sp. Yu-01 TaxID=3035694 RepID=UPI00240DDA6F|nr:hypothetical protein [Tissierella sp. Yu-01]WFA09415.1 hypothetical protein P3962_02240 [Tissierella sp. Yu-01]